MIWQREGLVTPECVEDATAEYLQEEDTIGRWIDECCVRDPQALTLHGALFESWKGWAESARAFIGSSKQLSAELKARDFACEGDEPGAGLHRPESRQPFRRSGRCHVHGFAEGRDGAGQRERGRPELRAEGVRGQTGRGRRAGTGSSYAAVAEERQDQGSGNAGRSLRRARALTRTRAQRKTFNRISARSARNYLIDRLAKACFKLGRSPRRSIR